MIIHVVQPGETIDSIAEKYGMSVERLIQDNEITNPNNLVVGQTIIIVYPKQVYTVQSGDTLESIANQFGISQLQILRNNPKLSESNILFEGETIVIDYDTKKIGDISTNGFAFPFIDMKLLRKILPYLTFLTINTYGLTPEGNLIQIDDAKIIELAKEYGVAPVMMISTVIGPGVISEEFTHTVLNNQEIQDRLISSIIDTMLTKGYISILLDFGYNDVTDRQAYVDFISKTAKQLQDAGLRIAIELTPNTTDHPGAIYEGHDYAGLGKDVNTVLIATYEWGYFLGPTMAMSPVNLMRQIFDYSVTVIPPEKIYFGMPTYGYDWSLPYVNGEKIPNTVSIVSAIELAVEVGTIIQYDEVSQAPFYTYTVNDGENVEHIVWFEDARSIDAKLKLVPEYGLRGVSVLNIMSYFAQLWLEINVQYNIRKLI